MTVFRTDIERALDELISYEEGMKFQGLGVILGKQRWPELIACERKWDRGLDAHAPATLSADGTGKGLACSLTATLENIESDAKKSQQNFDDVKVFIFATPEPVTNHRAKGWAHEIRKKFGYQLVVMPREDIITSLMLPSNAQLCRSILGIPVVIEESKVELIDKARDATAEVIASWLAHPRLSGKPLIALQAVKLDQEGRDTEDILDLEDIQVSLNEGRRVVLEAPAGRGKTTMLLQLAKQDSGEGRLAFFINLPAWVKSGLDILDFVSHVPSFLSRDIDAVNLAKLYQDVHFSFLLNGWNEISEIHSEGASEALRELERSFPAAGIIVATRAHHVSPPLPGAFRARLLPLTRSQRADYLKLLLGRRADELRSKLDNNPVLNDLTRTPLILSEVTTIFQSGDVIPTTKIGVLDAVMRLLEQSDEHRGHLQSAPLQGYAQRYLTELAIQLTMRGDTTIAEEEARTIANSASIKLRDAGHIATLSEPASILNTLCAHHVLERLDYPSDAFRFEHQQFQEFYAALLLKRQLWELAEKDTQTRNRDFAKQYVNEPAWEEPLCMVAEEIGVRSAEAPGDTDAVRSGKRLIEIALSIDPIFAGELSRLCGKVVWKEVRSAVGERLRSWYGVADENHRQCALAGMIATGSDDFIDIILPLLTSNDQQVRLSTYRAGAEFHLSILGPEWQNIVKGWKEDARIEFVFEATGDRWMPEIVKDFALGDPSPKVRAAAVQALSWVGSDQDIAKLLEALDEESFEQAVQKMYAEEIPPSLHARALALYQKILSESKDPLIRLRFLLKGAELGETGIAEKIKHELTALPLGKIEDAGEFVIKPAINIVRKTDPQWVSYWVAGRIVGGSLWRDSWITLVTSIPEDMKERLLQKVGGEDLQHTHKREIGILAAFADSSLAEIIFSKLFAIRRSFSHPRDPANQTKWTITRQLEDLLRTLPPNIAVAGLSNLFVRDFDAIEFTVVIHAFSTVGRDEPDLRSLLLDDLRQSLRRYLKNGLNFVLSQDDFSGEMKANLASALARVGKPEDMPDLAQLIKADIERARKGRAAWVRGKQSELANGGMMSYANWHVQALTSLDSESAETVLLDVLNEQEYEREAALALVRLARIRKTEEPFSFKPKDYSVVWEARAGRRSNEFDEERRQRYAVAIRQRINTLLDERARSAQTTTYDGRLKGLTKILATLDSHDSAELILHIMALPGKWDGWGRVDALSSLLFSGVQLPTKATLNVLNPTIEHTVAEGLWNDQNRSLLTNCLCLLPFLDDPSIGFARLRQVISETKFPVHELRDILNAVGGSRCDEALIFLHEIAGSLGDKLKHIRKEWIKAIAALGSPESKHLLLSFVDTEANEFPSEARLDDHESDLLASFIADMALAEGEIKQHILRLCDTQLSSTKRLLLCKVIAQLGTFDAVAAGLSLIDDGGNPSIPYDLYKAIKAVFIEERPYGKGGYFTLVPRGSNEIKAKLFEMGLRDDHRKQSAFALLGQIEVWRLEHGRPITERRHPAFDSGEKWPPIKTAG
jgi:HEAT repeat protein